MRLSINGIDVDDADSGAVVAAYAGHARSPHFETVERELRKVSGGACVLTGSTIGTQLHHCYVPFEVARVFGRWELEFSPRNLMFISQVRGNEKHLIIGHLGNFQSFNFNFSADIHYFKGMSDEDILNDESYKRAVKARPNSLHNLNDDEKESLKNRIDSILPLLQSELVEFAKYKPKDGAL